MYVEELKYSLRWKKACRRFFPKQTNLKLSCKTDSTMPSAFSPVVVFLSFYIRFSLVWFRQVGTTVWSASIENKDFLSLLKRDPT